MKNIILLGASGNIGQQVIDVVLTKPSEYKIVGLSLGHDTNLANQIIKKINPSFICLRSKEQLNDIIFDKEIFIGDEGLIKLVKLNIDAIVINALVGDVGLIPTVEAIKTKKDIALANKETLVLAGEIIMKLAKENNVKIIPIDSEHTALLSLINGKTNIKEVIITASGGALRDKNREELVNITKEEALNHPNWKMGTKITIDSATMMNKGFEVIEAAFLFNLKPHQIKTVLHKSSLVHAIVKFMDNSYHLNVSYPDMRLSILYALSYPNYLDNSFKDLDFNQLDLSFQKLNHDRYPCLSYAYKALEEGKFKLVQLNSSNDAAVSLYLENKIKFLEIEEIIKEYINKDYSYLEYNLENILKLNSEIKNEILKKYHEV